MNAPVSGTRPDLQHPEPPETVPESGTEAVSTSVLWLTPDNPDDIGDLLEYCDTDAASVAGAIERARERDGDALGNFVRRFDWDAIGTQYERAIVDAAY